MICRLPSRLAKFFKLTNIAVPLKIIDILVYPIIKWIVKGPMPYVLDINSTFGCRKDSVKCKIACGNSCLVSLRKSGSWNNFSSVFYSCRSPTLVLTRPITITHCFFSRLTGYIPRNWHWILRDVSVRMCFLDMDDFCSYSLGGKLKVQ